MVDLNHRRHTPTGLQPVPFGRSGNPPGTTSGPNGTLENLKFQRTCSRSWRWDSNPQPSVYKTDALPIELRQQNGSETQDLARRSNIVIPPEGVNSDHGFFNAPGSNTSPAMLSGYSSARTTTLSRSCSPYQDSSLRGTTSPVPIS